MKAVDLLNYLPEYLPGEGRLVVHGRRALLIDLAAFAALRTELSGFLGQEPAWRSFERFGYLMGHNAARRLRERYHWDNEREWLAAAPALMSWTGLAKVHLHTLDFQRARGAFLAELTWSDSFECEPYLRAPGLAPEPVCWTLAGYLSGYFSSSFFLSVLSDDDRSAEVSNHRSVRARRQTPENCAENPA